MRTRWRYQPSLLRHSISQRKVADLMPAWRPQHHRRSIGKPAALHWIDRQSGLRSQSRPLWRMKLNFESRHDHDQKIRALARIEARAVRKYSRYGPPPAHSIAGPPAHSIARPMKRRCPPETLPSLQARERRSVGLLLRMVTKRVLPRCLRHHPPRTSCGAAAAVHLGCHPTPFPCP